MLDIQQTLAAFKKLQVLIVGDVMLDEYVEGKVNRISPEAPVPIVEVKQKRHRAGGAANVALNIKALGATPFLCSVIGEDEKSIKLVQSLKEQDINPSYLYRSEHRKTTCKKRILSQGQQILRLDEEETRCLTKIEAANFLDTAQQILTEQTIDVIIFQDYNKGVLFSPTIRTLLLSAIRAEIPTIADPKVQNFYEYKGITLFKPNLREVNESLPFLVEPTMDSLQQATAYLHKRLGNEETLITLSSKGLFYNGKEKTFLLPTIPRIIADVCGAGDTVVSVAALGIAANMDKYEAAILCNLAGGQVCEKVGVVSVDKQLLMEDYKNYRKQLMG